MIHVSPLVKYGSIFFVFCVCASGFGVYALSQSNQNLRVTFADVGEGDGIIIQTPSHQTILLDGGPTHRFEKQVERALPIFDRSIDLVILTHPHADHSTGLIDMVRDFRVKRVVTSDWNDSSPETQEFEKLIREKNIPLEHVARGKMFTCGLDCSLIFLSPFQGERLDGAKQTNEEVNDFSLVTRLVFKHTSFLFMGDAGIEVENRIAEFETADFPLHADVLKIGHHGSRFSTTDEFLSHVHPQEGVISVGADNTFGHPNYEVVRRFKKRNTPLLRTDEQGTIEISSDGERLVTHTEK